MAFQHRCEHLSTLRHIGGNRSGHGTGKPRTARCLHCGGRWIVTEGMYYVLRHRGDGRYHTSDALAVAATERGAESAAARLDPSGDTICVRFLSPGVDA